MFFIFGISPKTIKTEQGTFICPVCRQHSNYQLNQQQNYFSLFFIKVFPVSKAKAPYLVCQRCHTVMPTSVLNQR